MIEDLTSTQLDLARHALGAESQKPGFRNYFCATPGSPDDAEWQAMVDLGAAKLYGEPRSWLPYNTYSVAEECVGPILAMTKEK